MLFYSGLNKIGRAPTSRAGAARSTARAEETSRERHHPGTRRGGTTLCQTRHQRHLFARSGSASVAGGRRAALHVPALARRGSDDGVGNDHAGLGDGRQMLPDGRYGHDTIIGAVSGWAISVLHGFYRLVAAVLLDWAPAATSIVFIE